METTLKRKYILAIVGVSVLFVINALGLFLEQRFDQGFRTDPSYSSYLRIRTLVLEPSTSIAVACALAIWSGFIYWRSRRHVLTDGQRIIYICLVLSAIYGYVLTACFKL
jgi:hypothetical protein